ncbi:MAG: Hint domain-containing protein [Rhodobacteraceae bacterium]|nr:Hint domain-containing protein [Paracoccaceae bacterium]
MGRFVPFSFADRSDLWPADLVDATDAGLQCPDVASLAQGLIAGTLVATDLGWQPVEDLQAGDRIVTFDHGMRPLKAVRISTLHTAAGSAPSGVWPLSIPAGVLGNRTAMRVLPGQPLLIESDAAEVLYGDAFLMVPAGVLDGYKGIQRVAPEREVTVVTLEFEGDEVVYTNGTLLVQCAAAESRAYPERVEHARCLTPVVYQRLTEQQGRRLVAAMTLNG